MHHQCSIECERNCWFRSARIWNNVNADFQERRTAERAGALDSSWVANDFQERVRDARPALGSRHALASLFMGLARRFCARNVVAIRSLGASAPEFSGYEGPRA